ncbi:MAG: redoxin domain-containing protein [Chloroflexi bacterium]|nr:redoxin domain-containing protein [Chloroflexota bacterium]
MGDRAPDYTLNLPQNRQVSSTDLVAQGKPVFILFHATW